MRMKSLLVGLTALALSATAAEASISFDLPAGDTTTVYSGVFNGWTDSGITDISAKIQFSLYDKTGDIWTIVFDLWNTTDPLTQNSTVTLFGFNSLPNIIGATTSDDWDIFVFNDSLPGNTAVEICIKEAGNTQNCNSGSLGIDAGQHTSFKIAFQVADGSANVMTLDNFWVRYQSVGPDYEDSGIGTLIPEPATWIMMILGFAGMGTALKYRRRREYGALAA